MAVHEKHVIDSEKNQFFHVVVSKGVPGYFELSRKGSVKTVSRCFSSKINPGSY
jgi:hypothetical protein